MEDVEEPKYYGRFEPVYPCREMETRHCPVVYNDVCGDRPCARFESKEEEPWIPEVIESAKRNYGISGIEVLKRLGRTV